MTPNLNHSGQIEPISHESGHINSPAKNSVFWMNSYFFLIGAL